MKESKTIRIDKEVYSQVKEYCDKNALKISRWISIVLREKLDEKERDNIQEELS